MTRKKSIVASLNFDLNPEATWFYPNVASSCRMTKPIRIIIIQPQYDIRHTYNSPLEKQSHSHVVSSLFSSALRM